MGRSKRTTTATPPLEKAGKMPDALHLAVVAGEMYDGLYRRLTEFEGSTGIRVEIAYHAPHPHLNAHLASLSDIPYDLISSHSKYAPSQLHLLAPLDDLADELEIGEFYPSLIDLASIEGHLYGIPRNIDIKLLHYRTDLLQEPPEDWNRLLDLASQLSRRAMYGFVFPGTESGLFGLFYELAEMGGAALFPKSNKPQLNNAGGKWALEMIRDLYQSGAVPPEITGWQYVEAHRCFREGRAAMI
jgi:multiple sugar transport system substrate-binding protein